MSGRCSVPRIPRDALGSYCLSYPTRGPAQSSQVDRGSARHHPFRLIRQPHACRLDQSGLARRKIKRPHGLRNRCPVWWTLVHNPPKMASLPRRTADRSVPLVKARFILAAAVVAAALGLGFGGRGVRESRDAVVAKVPELRLDPNTVPPQVLTALPHIGPALVDRWVEAREERPFLSLEDARSRVRGSARRRSSKSRRTLITPERPATDCEARGEPEAEPVAVDKAADRDSEETGLDEVVGVSPLACASRQRPPQGSVKFMHSIAAAAMGRHHGAWPVCPRSACARDLRSISPGAAHQRVATWRARGRNGRGHAARNRPGRGERALVRSSGSFGRSRQGLDFPGLCRAGRAAGASRPACRWNVWRQ